MDWVFCLCMNEQQRENYWTKKWLNQTAAAAEKFAINWEFNKHIPPDSWETFLSNRWYCQLLFPQLTSCLPKIKVLSWMVDIHTLCLSKKTKSTSMLMLSCQHSHLIIHKYFMILYEVVIHIFLWSAHWGLALVGAFNH